MPPDERRQQLLDAVLEVIVECGVHKVSIESVARSAGVTRPVVYRHFPDSDALLRASLDREEQRVNVQLRETFRNAIDFSENDAVGKSSVLVFYNEMLRMFESSPNMWRAVLHLADSSTPEFRAAFERGREYNARMLASIISADSDARDLAVDADLYAKMIFALLIESGRLILSQPDVYPRRRLILFAKDALSRLR